MEDVSDYKPQISDANTLGYVAANMGLIQPYTPAPEPETNIFFRDYSSPFSCLWDAEGAGAQVCLLDKINLVLNNDRSGQNHAFSSAQEEQNALLENQWEKTLYSEGVQEQTLVPDELVSCLRAMNGGSVDIQTCFPQSIGRLFWVKLWWEAHKLVTIWWWHISAFEISNIRAGTKLQIWNSSP